MPSTPAISRGDTLSLPLATDIADGDRLYINTSGQWAVCDASTKAEGFANAGPGAAGAMYAATLRHGGTVYARVAAAGNAVGDLVYAAAGGEIDDSGTVVEGKVVSAGPATGAADDLVEILPTDPYTAPA